MFVCVFGKRKRRRVSGGQERERERGQRRGAKKNEAAAVGVRRGGPLARATKRAARGDGPLAIDRALGSLCGRARAAVDCEEGALRGAERKAAARERERSKALSVSPPPCLSSSAPQAPITGAVDHGAGRIRQRLGSTSCTARASAGWRRERQGGRASGLLRPPLLLLLPDRRRSLCAKRRGALSGGDDDGLVDASYLASVFSSCLGKKNGEREGRGEGGGGGA